MAVQHAGAYRTGQESSAGIAVMPIGP